MQPEQLNSTQEKQHLIPASVATPVRLSWILLLVYLLASTIYFFLAQPELPLLYTLATKADQLSPKYMLFVFPLISLTINLFHFFIIRILRRYSVVLLKLFAGTTVALQVLLGFALIRIIIITI